MLNAEELLARFTDILDRLEPGLSLGARYIVLSNVLNIPIGSGEGALVTAALKLAQGHGLLFTYSPEAEMGTFERVYPTRSAVPQT